MSHINGKIKCLCDRIDSLANQVDLDNQTLSLTGTTLTISNGNNVDLASLLDDTDISGVSASLSGTTLTVSVTEDGNTVSDTVELCSIGSKTIYTEVLTPGVVEQIWSGGGNSAAHANPSEIFIGAPGTPNGLPGHVNGAPDIDIVVADWIDNTANDPSNGADQFRYYGWIEILQDGTQIRDINANTGELLRIWHATCCSAAQVVFEGPGTRGAGTFATLDAGWHFIAFEGSDSSAYAGVQLQTDVGGNGVFTNFSGRTSITCPDYTCREEDGCYVLKAGESLCAPKCNLPANAIIPVAAGDTNTDEQQLSISGDTISLTNGGSVTVAHPTVTPEICTGPFVDQTNRTGWVQTWTTPYTAASGTITGDWIQISTTETSPSCDTDVHVSVDFGVLYYQLRRMRMYQWVDWRLLVNGAPVYTETYDEYNYTSDRTQNDIDPLDIESRPMGHSNAVRNNVPAGATLAVEVRYRWNFSAPQTSAYGRLIQGLRSHATFTYHPRNIVTNVTTN